MSSNTDETVVTDTNNTHDSSTYYRKRLHHDDSDNSYSDSKSQRFESLSSYSSKEYSSNNHNRTDINAHQTDTYIYNNSYLYGTTTESNERKKINSYNLRSCESMALQMKEFMKKFEAYQVKDSKYILEERVILYNALSDTNLHYTTDIPISLESLQEYFSVSGHSLYIDLTNNYVTNLVLNLQSLNSDTDLYILKLNDEEITSHLHQTVFSIWKEINTFLDLSSLKFPENVAVFAENNCNIYIYINVSVSINVYSYIINVLNVSQSDCMQEVLKKYKINHLSYLPLPYVANHDNRVLTSRLQRQGDKCRINIFPSIAKYIDFRMQLSNYLNNNIDVVLAKITYNYSCELSHLYHDEVTQEWDITDKMEMETVYVNIITNETQDNNNSNGIDYTRRPIFENDARRIPAFIRSHRKFVLESINYNFKKFAQNLLKESLSKDYNTENNHKQKFSFRHKYSTDLECKILMTLDSIGRNIARHVYQVETLLPDSDVSNFNTDQNEQQQYNDSFQENKSSFNKINNGYYYIGHLIQFCYEPDYSAGYAFYVLTLSIMYTMQKLSINSNDRKIIISILRQVISGQEVYEKKQLLWILESLLSVNCMSELERVFPEPLRILKNLATSIFMRRRVESRLTNDALSSFVNSNYTNISHTSMTRSLVSTTPISYDVLLFDELCRLYLHEELSLYRHLSDLMLEEIVTTIFRRYLILFNRNIMTNNVMYMYKDPLYIEYKMSNFVNDNTANSKLRFMNDKLLIYIMQIIQKKTSQSNESKCRNRANKIIKNAWYNYSSEHIPVRNVHFGKYRYFVCTLRGIFNNITGLYMCGIPQLYFENASSFCILPPLGVGDSNCNTGIIDKKYYPLNERCFNNGMSMVTAVDDVSGHNYHAYLREINEELIVRINKWKKHVYVYISSQDKLFYLSVMVPGLLKIGESIFNKQTRSLIINSLTDRLYNDNDAHNHEELFYLLPVMQYHSFSCNSIMAIARCVDILTNEKHTSVTSHTLEDLISTLYKNDVNNIYDEIGGKQKERFYYENYFNANDLYKSIVGLYTFRPDRRTVALAFIWTLIEWDNKDDSNISTRLEIQRQSYDYRILKKTLKSAATDKISVTLRDDPFGLTRKPFNLRQFTCETNENFRRAFDITFQSTPLRTSELSDTFDRNEDFKSMSMTSAPNQPLDICMYNAFLSISIIFRFDARTIEDYLKHSTLLFQPFNNCRKFTLYYGEPRCGKSFLANLIIRAAEPSVFNVLSDLTTAASAASPSPDLIKAFQSYVVCIKEVRRLAESLLKTITGEDHMDQRDLYKGYQKLTPICFIFGCTNQIPHIDADEAIKDRLSIFHFINRVEPCYNFRESIDDNQLLLYINECTIQPQIEEFATSIGLYNTFYSMFCIARNQFGLVIPTINNHSSKQIIKKFLIHNSLMYSIMDECGIEVCIGYSIKMNDLKHRAKSALEKSKRAMRSNYQLHDFINDFTQHFRKFQMRSKVSHNEEFIGVGLPPSEIDQINPVEVIFDEVCRYIHKSHDANKTLYLHISELRKFITYKVKKIIKTSADRETEYITRILLKVKSIYHEFYSIEEQNFRNLQIINKLE